MKNILKFFMLAAALSFAACEEKPVTPPEPEEPEVELNQDLEFTLEVTEVEATQAKIKVSHNGTSADTWYGFVTDEVSKKEGTLIAEEVQALLATGKVSGLKKQTSANVTLKNLNPQTDYKYVVFGLSAEGEVYGVYKSVSFKTVRDASKLEETNDWKITYQRGENQGAAAEIFTIECAEGKGFYFTTIEAATLEANELQAVDYVKYVIESEVPMLLEYGYKWSDLYIPESYTLASPRSLSGDYVAFAIGYDSKGEPTGYYSVQEYTIVEETAKADYTQWLGNYDLTMSYKYQDEETGEILTEDFTYNVTLHHIDNNYMYAMTGWEENGDAINDIREFVGEYAIPVYYNNGKLAFNETDLEYVEFDGAGEHLFGFYGIGDLTMSGKSYEGTLIGFDGLTMAVAETTDGGQTAVIKGTSQSVQGYEIDYTGMFYCAYPTSGEGDLAYWNYPMEFPLTMTKQAETKSSVMVNTASVQSTDLKVKSMKKIQKKDFTPMYIK